MNFSLPQARPRAVITRHLRHPMEDFAGHCTQSRALYAIVSDATFHQRRSTLARSTPASAGMFGSIVSYGERVSRLGELGEPGEQRQLGRHRSPCSRAPRSFPWGCLFPPAIRPAVLGEAIDGTAVALPRVEATPPPLARDLERKNRLEHSDVQSARSLAARDCGRQA